MTFLEALTYNRPMRRGGSYVRGPWLFLGNDGSVCHAKALWRRIDTGEVTGLDKFAYLATDWEVMP